MKMINIQIKVPKEINEKLLDEVARQRKETGIRTSKEKIIIETIKERFNNGN
jgi:hypothetical protein